MRVFPVEAHDKTFKAIKSPSLKTEAFKEGRLEAEPEIAKLDNGQDIDTNSERFRQRRRHHELRSKPSQTAEKHEGERDSDSDRRLGRRTMTFCDMMRDGDRLWSI